MLIRMRSAAVVFTAALLGTVLSPQHAFAKDSGGETTEKKKVAVGTFVGQKNSEIRAAVIDALKSSGSYDVSETSDVKPDSVDGSFAESAKGLGVAAIVVARVKKGFVFVVSVRSGSDGALIEDVELPGGGLIKLKKQIREDLVGRIEGPLSQAKAEEKASEETPEAAAPAEAGTEAEEAGASASGRGISPFDVTVGLRAVHRKLEFKNTIAEAQPGAGYSKLLSYELPLGPALFIDLNWYPAAHFTSGPATWFGVTAGFEKGFATESVYAEGKAEERTLKTDLQQWYAGARFRLPFAEHQVGAAATFGNHKFELKGNEGFPLIVPDVNYQYIRIGVDGLFRFGNFLVGARVGKRIVSKAGEIESLWFKNAKTQSLEAGALVGYRLFGPLDLVAGFDWLRYAYDFNPVTKTRTPQTASIVAGGAVDEYFSGFLAFRYTLPGGAEEAGATASNDGAATTPASSE